MPCSNELISSRSPSLDSPDGLRVVAVAEPLGLERVTWDSQRKLGS